MYLEKRVFVGISTLLQALCCIGWLYWVKQPFETVFQSISGPLPKRGRQGRERIDKSKNSKQPPTAPTASAEGPCPTITQIVGRPGGGGRGIRGM